MARVVVLPGVAGSAIELDRWVLNTRYWCVPPKLVLDGPLPLLVNEEGTGDAPNFSFRRTVITGLLESYYGRLVRYLADLGHQVYAAGYDWRLGVERVARAAWPGIQQWAGDDPIYLVGHSLGGIVGRALIRVAAEAGRFGQIARLVTLGTPHRGSVSITRLWAHLSLFWKLMAVVYYPSAAVTNAIYTGAGPLEVLDRVIGSLVSTYSLLPQPGSPALTGGYDYAAATNRGTYLKFNGWLLKQRFEAVAAEHAWIQGAVYPTKQISVIGTGLLTAYGVRDVARLASNDGYYYNDNGDSTVDVASATLEGVPFATVTGIEHQALPYEPRVLVRIPPLLFGGG